MRLQTLKILHKIQNAFSHRAIQAAPCWTTPATTWACCPSTPPSDVSQRDPTHSPVSQTSQTGSKQTLSNIHQSTLATLMGNINSVIFSV